MNPMDFMQAINDLDESLIQSSVEFMQEDSMKQTFKRGGSTLSKLILVAAMLAGILGVSVLASETFPSIFGQLKREYTQLATEYPSVQEEADLYERAAEVNETFEAQYFQLRQLDDSQITIGETYYDGKNLLIAYRMDEAVTPAQFGFGPDSERYEELSMVGAATGTSEQPTFEDFLKQGSWTQQAYDEQVAAMEELGLDSIHHVSSSYILMNYLKTDLTEEEYTRAIRELQEKGHVGVVYRTIYIGDHILVEGEDCLVPNSEGEVWWEDVTEYGNCIRSDAFDESLPEKFRNLDKLTLSLKVRANDTYVYIDKDTGGWLCTELGGEVLVPVPLTKTAQ